VRAVWLLKIIMAEVKDLVIAYPYGELIFNAQPGTEEAYAELDL
jgi:hypothetical protein